MAKLEGQKIADSYEQLLHTDNNGGGNGTTLVDIKDGKNDTTFALKLATDKIQVNGNATITTADNTDTLTLTSTDADANSGPNLRLYRNSASPADSDVFGQIDFEGRNDNSQDFVGARIKVAAGDVSDGTEDTQLEFDIMTGGTLREYMRMASGGTPAVIFNQDSRDIDFRVLSDNLDPAFFVQGSDGNVGIGTSSPNEGKLVVQDSTKAELVIKTSATATDTEAALMFKISTDTVDQRKKGGIIYKDVGDNGIGDMFFVLDSATDNGSATVADNAVMAFKNNGNVGIGTSSPDAKLELETDGADQELRLSCHSDTEAHTNTLSFLKSDNTAASPATIDSGAVLGTIAYYGYDDNGYDTGAKVVVSADANWSATERGTKMSFYTRDANEALSENLIIGADGNVGIGLSAPTAPLHVKGANDSYVQLWNNHSDVNIGGMYNNTGHGVLQVKNSSAATKINLNSDSDSYFTGGNVLVGYTTATTNGGDTPQLQTHKTNNSNGLGVFQWGNNAAHSAMIKLAHSKSGTIGSHTILADNDSIGTIQFTGSDGTNFDTLAGSIHVEVDGTPAANRIPGAMTFSTSAVSDDGNAERMRITSSGQVLIGGTTDTAFTPSFSVQGTQPSISAYKDADAFVNIVVEEDHVDIVYDHAKDLRIGHATNVGGTSRTSNMILDANSRISLSNNDGDAGNCTFFGYLTGATNGGGGDRNCAFGHQALTANSAGDDNTVYGYQAGLVAGTTSAAVNNTLIGSGSGKAIDQGDYNTCLGYASGDTIATGEYNTVIGNSTDVSASGASNQIVIGSGATGQADNSVTLGNASVTAVYMAQDSGATVHCLDVKPTGGGALKENMINNSDFAVWSNSTPQTTGSDLVTNGAFSSDTSGWTAVRATLSSVSGGQSGNCLSVSRDSGDDQSAFQNITTSAVVGQLYKATVYVKDGTASSQQFHLQLYSGSEYRRTIGTTTSSWVQHTIYITATDATVGVTLRKNSSDAGSILFDTSVAHISVAGCVAADSLMADGWAKDNNNDCFRIYGSSSFNRDGGSPYSLEVDFASGNEIFYPRGNIQADPTWFKRFQGQTVTLGCWVYSSAATLVKLSDNDGESSATHTGGGGWEWLEVTRTCDSSITFFRTVFRGAGTETAYFTQPILALGHSIGSGGYTKPINEVVYPEEVIKILSLDNKTGANGFSDVSDTPIDLQADTEGKMPYNARAINLNVSSNDSASASGAGLIFFTGLNGDKAEVISRPHGKTNDTVDDASAEIVLRDIYTSNGAGGNLNYTIDASGSNTFDVTQAFINKVILK